MTERHFNPQPMRAREQSLLINWYDLLLVLQRENSRKLH